MSDKFREAHRKMRHAGADARRADPSLIKPLTFTLRQAATIAIIVFAVGAFVGMASLGASVTLTGHRLASAADMRIVGIVRTALPDADTLAQDDIVARLLVPPQVVQLMAPLVALDPARAQVAPVEWLEGLHGGPQATLPERMRALGEIASSLAELPDQERLDQISTLVALYRATRDTSSRKIIWVVGTLPEDMRQIFAADGAFKAILDTIAAEPESDRRIVVADPQRLRLALSAATLLTQNQIGDFIAGIDNVPLRKALIYIIDQVRSGNNDILDLMTCYWYQSKSSGSDTKKVSKRCEVVR